MHAQTLCKSISLFALTTALTLPQQGFSVEENWLKMDEISWLQEEPVQRIEEISTTQPVHSPEHLLEQEMAILAENNPEKVIAVAFDFLKRGIFDQSDRLFTLIEKNEAYKDVAQYGRALILSQKGSFKESLKKFNEITPQKVDTESWLSYKNRLNLFIAAEAYQNNEKEEAHTWLQAFDKTFASPEDTLFAQRIYARLFDLEKKNSSERFRIGMLLPLSGSLKPIGEDMLKAMQLSLFDAQKPSLYIYPQDTQGTQEGTLKAAEAAFQDGAQVIIGPLLSENTAVATDIARYHRTPVISFSSQKQVAGKNTYLLSFIPEKQAEYMAAYATNKGIRSVAALVPDNDYGQKMLVAFKKAAEKQGLSFKREAFYTPGATDHKKALDILGQMPLARQKFNSYKSLLEKEYTLLGEAMDDVSLTAYKDIQTAMPEAIVDFEALFLPAAPSDIALLTSQMAFYDMDASQIMLMGTGQWQDPSIVREQTDYIRGALFPRSGDAQQQKAFTERFKSIYGHQPHPVAILAYDAIKMISEAHSDQNTHLYRLEEAFRRPEGFNLTSGLVRFDKKGIPHHNYRTFTLSRTRSYTEEMPLKVMPPKLPKEPNPLKASKGVFNFFQNWRF